ncbi:S-adenosyl-L-methionine-dependent methyltransferase [Fimicolochytrium jonesii]|uniref:S-adenosyl-L-methionine-dependent methyltransferase n=1 Tax=Fimicolochytrium jonesii TaxID=1396493 RepID=UPI0022FF2720|nr:S-adenosyl-L-methionine-dependent methyltransferase [Fimicolochytrium jonesii]KAI8820575.1 S-adenosyl-L-methionine-dependent methyltransferase [Fimicolochytrium jonesii]
MTTADPSQPAPREEEEADSPAAVTALFTYLHSLTPTTDPTPVLPTVLSPTTLLHTSTDPTDPENQPTPLHIAARKGNLAAVQWMLLKGAPWNAIDARGVSVGEYAKEAGWDEVYEALVCEGVRTELVLMALGKGTTVKPASAHPSNASYLSRRLTFSSGRLLDSDANAVMMGWEAPLMTLHAAVIAPTPGKRVLNVGFGLGLIDTDLQTLSPSHHVIIEAHPDVYAHMVAEGWTTRPNVTVIFSRWQDALPQLYAMPEPFDGIFFDTFGEYYDDLKEFHEHVPNLLAQSGVYSFFNGLAGTNPFFHDVACALAEADLRDMGLRCEFREVQVDELGDETWKGIKRAYWSLPVYRLPVCTFDEGL